MVSVTSGGTNRSTSGVQHLIAGHKIKIVISYVIGRNKLASMSSALPKEVAPIRALRSSSSVLNCASRSREVSERT